MFVFIRGSIRGSKNIHQWAPQEPSLILCVHVHYSNKISVNGVL